MLAVKTAFSEGKVLLLRAEKAAGCTATVLDLERVC